VTRMQRAWSAVRAEPRIDPNAPHEAQRLMLDCSKARARLGWMPVWDGLSTAEITAAWYRRWYEQGELMSTQDIKRYTEDARQRGVREI